MNKLYFIIGAAVIVAIIVAVYYNRIEIIRYLKSEDFKESVHKLMIKAEKLYASGEGKAKLEYVVDMAVKYLPASAQVAAKKFMYLLVEELFERYKRVYVDDNGVSHSVVE